MYLAYPKLIVGTASLSSSSTSTIRSAHEPKAAGRPPDACQQMARKRARATLGREPSVLYLVFPPPFTWLGTTSSSYLRLRWWERGGVCGRRHNARSSTNVKRSV
jgi:hypothetical protein